MIYRDTLIKIRVQLNLSQKDIANILNISRGAYSIYELEIKFMPIKYLDILCNYFSVSFDYLFEFTTNENYANTKLINIDKSVNRLKEFRKDNDLTQIKLAQILNVAKGTIANYECGRNFIATPFLYEICKRYNISADYLLGKIDKPKYLK